jgi:signal transduction histidine kinase
MNNDYYLSIKRRTYDANGKPNGLSGAAIPFNKTHQMIESLRDTADQQLELIEKKDQFIQSAFHDIRGPLTGFYGLVESIKAQCPDSIRTEVLELSQYLDRYLSMVDDILTDKILSSHEESKACMINESINSIVSLYRINAKQKGLAFNVSNELPPQLCIHARCDSIKRILMNFLTNAIKFTDQGSVEIRCYLIDPTDTKATLCCEVHDTWDRHQTR